MSKKVLLNKSPEGFGLSSAALEMFLQLTNAVYYYHEDNFRPMYLKIPASQYKIELAKAKNSNDLRAINSSYVYSAYDIPRDHPALWEIYEKIGISAMQDKFSKLSFAEVGDDAVWSIREIADIEYLTINPNPKPKFVGKSEHWYPADFRPEWMDPQKDSAVVVGTNKSGVIISHICSWNNIYSNLIELEDYKWYPLSKLCPIYNAN